MRYNHSMAYSDETRPARWMAKVIQADGCWEWSGYRTPAGYGMFRWGGDRRITAHRAGYLMHVGTIPEGWEIDHLCRNRGCVNLAHLRVVTHAENCARADYARGTRLPNGRKTHCAHGHALSGANIRINRNGSRACRECGRQAMQRFRDARR
jgi:hypothetical protein